MPKQIWLLAGLGALLAILAANDRARLAALDTWDELTDMTDLDAALNNRNVQAFLRMIRAGEGTADANGYRRIVGGALFDSFADHPRVLVTLKRRDGTPVINPKTGGPLKSTAAGAYQFTVPTWTDAVKANKFADFAPPTQDAAAVWLIRKQGALADVIAGRFADAVRKCAPRWASLPGSDSGQPQKSMQQAMAVYQQAGGTYA